VKWWDEPVSPFFFEYLRVLTLKLNPI